MSYFVIIRGPLGVGKTTISKELAEQINGEYLSIDQVLADNGLDKIDDPDAAFPLENFIKANDIVLNQIQNYGKDKSVVIDGNFYYKDVLMDLEQKLNFPKIFTLKCPVEICIERDSKRVNSYGRDTVEYIHSEVSKFDYGINIDASKETPKEIVADIQKKL